jgi:hypothetical protein
MKPFFYFLSLGSFITALGLGAKFAKHLADYAIPLIVGGLLIHGTGHVLQYRNWRANSAKR